MARRVSPVLIALVAALCLTSCGFLGRPERPIWRAQAENACFARKQVALSDAIVPAPEIDGPGICGMTRPLKVSALDNGSIAVDQTLTIDCPMIPALEAWLKAIVEPDAQTRFGQRVATVKVFGAYSCRGIDNMPGARLSEHAFGNGGRRRRLHARRRPRDRLRPRLEEDRHPGSRFPARGPRGRLPIFHHRLRSWRGRVPLQPHPSRSRQSRLDRHRPSAHLQADACARSLAGASAPRRPPAGARY